MSEAAARPSSSSTFSPRVVLWMLLIGLFSASAFVALSAYAPDLRGGSDAGAHALSRSAVGYAGLVRLLRADGDGAVTSRDPSGDRAWSLLVLTPDTLPDKTTLAALAARGPTLLVAPKWMTAPEAANPGWVDQVGPIDAKAIVGLLQPLAGPVTLSRRTDTSAAQLTGLAGATAADPMLTGPIEQLQTFQSTPSLVPLVSDQRGGVVLAGTADRRLFFLSDPDFLNNQGIAALANARAGAGMIESLRQDARPVAFDLSLNGFGASRSLLKLVLSPPYLGATLCLLAAGLLIGLHAANRFGAPAPTGRTLAFGKTALADNSAALIRLARREPRMAGRYLDLCRKAVVEALGRPRVPDEALDGFLDGLAEKSGIEQRLSELVPQARTARTSADLLKVARSLYQWRTEMTGERR